MVKPVIGHCYWYDPEPKASDSRCEHCGFLFASDYSGPPSIVLIVHVVRRMLSYCPRCQQASDLSPEHFYRGERINVLRKDVAIVEDKWLRRATPAAVTAYCLTREDEADALLGRRTVESLPVSSQKILAEGLGAAPGVAPAPFPGLYGGGGYKAGLALADNRTASQLLAGLFEDEDEEAEDK